MKQPANPTGSSYVSLLRDRGFASFLLTQFLGAWNDNAYKITVSLLTVMLIADPRQNSAYIATAGFLFVLPFVLFSGYAGQLADRHSKRHVLIVTKLLEGPAMLLGLWAFAINSPQWMLAVVFVMALQSTFFGPAKYGILPEMLPLRALSRANGLLEMSTFVAIILGTTAAGFLFEVWAGSPWKVSVVLIIVALLGSAASLGITRVAPPRSREPFAWNPLREVIAGSRTMFADRTLLLTIVGISFFWFLGALFQMDLLLFAKQSMDLSDSGAGILVAGLAVGIGAGSMLAGRISGEHIELGLVAPGCLGMALSAFAVVAAAPHFLLTVSCLVVLGMFGGLFIVPLNAMLQHRPAAHEKGRIMGVNNFYNAIAMLLASAVLWLFTSLLGWSPDTVILIAGGFTLLSTVLVLWQTPEDTLRVVLGSILRLAYRFDARNAGVVPVEGPALLVANHVSFLDGFLIGACLPRIARFMVWDNYYDRFRWLLAPIGAIPVPLGGRRAVLTSISAARQALLQGHLVCIFPEGSITRTGEIQQFQRGMERVAEGLDIPVIPVHLGGVWGSIFSRGNKRRLLWRGYLRRTIKVSFGDPLPAPARAEDAREQVLALGGLRPVAESAVS